jgi:hypothetical protein
MVLESKDKIIKKKRRIRLRFKILLRKVILNSAWIFELDEKKIGLNAKKNIAILTRPTKEKSSYLTIVEKRIIHTPLEKRTDEQKEVLNKAFQVLPCLQQFTPLVRSRLADVAEFQYFPADKTILKEGHPAAAMWGSYRMNII